MPEDNNPSEIAAEIAPEVVGYVVYPAIGIARVGNSEQFFLGPEVPGQQPKSPIRSTSPNGLKVDEWKDAEGRVLRQAARFRVYGVDANGKPVQEITADHAKIQWRVHLANRKAAWYQFLNAMDLGQYALEAPPRNAAFQGDRRSQLVIDPGSRQISGRGQGGDPAHAFDSGTFVNKPVYLGELQTDSQGRLLVLGGRGHSASYNGKPAVTFANNDGWHDDTSDGPVRATVTIDGQELEAEPAMVAVCPPNFGQGLYGVVTMYDVVYDLFGQGADGTQAPERPSFWRDILPILERLSGNQAANQGVFFGFGHGSNADFHRPDLIERLADPSPAHEQLRRSLAVWFKNPNLDDYTPTKLPPFYGDTFNDFPDTSQITLAITKTQFAWLEAWARGDFDPDPSLRPDPQRELASLSASAQAAALDQASLEDILGGPFHPGIELTWFLRLKSMSKRPYRLNVLTEDEPVRDDYGPILRPAEALSEQGPFTHSGPGTLTRFMGVPWQTDEASCRSGYAVGTYLPLPSFWAARVPNQTLSQQAYERVLDQDLSLAQRHKHFDYRQDWLRFFGPGYQTEINNMVANWDKIGILAARPGPDDCEAADLPSKIWIETGLDEKTYGIRSDPTWIQLLKAEGFGEEPERLAHLAMAEDAAVEEETALPPDIRRPVRPRDM